jgi:hypothetical protein
VSRVESDSHTNGGRVQVLLPQGGDSNDCPSGKPGSSPLPALSPNKPK